MVLFLIVLFPVFVWAAGFDSGYNTGGTTSGVASCTDCYLYANAPATVNWLDITDLTVNSVTANSISTPAGASTTQSLTVGTSPNQANITSGGALNFAGTAGINWDSTVDTLATINWSTVTPMKTGGINWQSVQDLDGSGVGGRVFSKEINATINSPATGITLLWQNLTGMVMTLTKLTGYATASSSGALVDVKGDTNGAVNWSSINEIEPIDFTTLVDPDGLGTGAAAGINYYNLTQAQVGTINWSSIQNYDYIGINWQAGAPTEAHVAIQGKLNGAGN